MDHEFATSFEKCQYPTSSIIDGLKLATGDIKAILQRLSILEQSPSPSYESQVIMHTFTPLPGLRTHF